MTAISDINPAPVIFRVFICLVLGSNSITAQASQADLYQSDLFAVQIARPDNGQQNSYRFFNTALVTEPTKPVFGKTSLLPDISEFKMGAFWITSIRWHLGTDSNYASFSPRIRFDSKDNPLESQPFQRSVLITLSRAFP